MRTSHAQLSATLFAVATIAGAGCSATVPGQDPGDKAPSTWTIGKDNGSFKLVEAGPAPVGERWASITLVGNVPGYRVESFGDMNLVIDLAGHGGTDAYVVVEGPLDGYGDTVAVGAGDVVGEDDDSGSGTDSHLEIDLSAPGVYRILAGTFESLGEGSDAANGSLTLQVACTANCNRAQMDQPTFVQSLGATAGSGARQLREQRARPDDPRSDVVGAVSATAADDPRGSGSRGARALPDHPAVGGVDDAAAAHGAIPSSAPDPTTAVVTGDLMTRARPVHRRHDRSDPAPVSADLPGVAYGSFPNRTLSPCEAAHSSKLGARS